MSAREKVFDLRKSLGSTEELNQDSKRKDEDKAMDQSKNPRNKLDPPKGGTLGWDDIDVSGIDPIIDPETGKPMSKRKRKKILRYQKAKAERPEKRKKYRQRKKERRREEREKMIREEKKLLEEGKVTSEELAEMHRKKREQAALRSRSR
eukprot:1344501-Amorphochlora_amoeboformis.AAC.1